MIASLTSSAYFENDCLTKVSGRENRLYACAPADGPGKKQRSPADRFTEILNHSVADMDDDETLLAGKDRVSILTVNVF